MAFDVAGEAYQRFMGGFSDLLAGPFADLAGVSHGGGTTALDVGCGPGVLTAVLVERLGAAAVRACDPSAPFVAATRARLPGVDVRQAGAEDLPLEADTVDHCLAQLVVHFMSDPARGIGEMARVTRPGGVVAASVWDFGGGRGPLTTFEQAATELDPDFDGERSLVGARRGVLADLFAGAGLVDVVETELTVHRPYPGFEEWWETYTLGVGPAGDYVARLDEAGRAALKDGCRTRFPGGPFTVDATAWAARGTVPPTDGPGRRPRSVPPRRGFGATGA